MEPFRRLFFISLGAADFVTYDPREVFLPTSFCQENVIIRKQTRHGMHVWYVGWWNLITSVRLIHIGNNTVTIEITISGTFLGVRVRLIEVSA